MRAAFAQALEALGWVDVSTSVLPEEVSAETNYFEGSVARVLVNAYERDPKAREKCVAKFGARCRACGVDLGEKYGEAGRGYIHVHHKRPLSEVGGTHKVDPAKDLCPVCPNCHAIIHRRTPAYGIEDVQQMLLRNRHDMPAKDLFHEPVIKALIKDGWRITDDPLTLKVGTTDFFIDLGADRFLGAERDNERIAVEIKSFVGASRVQDLKEAIGQFVLYENALRRSEAESDRLLFLAVREITFTAVFEEEIGKMVLDSKSVRLIVFDPTREEIKRWIR